MRQQDQQKFQSVSLKGHDAAGPKDLQALASVRKEIARAKRVVIKVGTNVLASKDGTLSLKRIQSLADQIASARRDLKKEVVLVTSGAIGAGMGVLKVAARPKELPELQALASVGQCQLMRVYQEAFSRSGTAIGQVLLTLDDIRNRKRHLNTTNTLMCLLRKGVVPVINENDTVAVDEIKFGDNDILSAMVAILIRADLLVILSTVDGFYDTENAMVIEHVVAISDDVRRHVRLEKSALGTGGMDSKLRAIEKILEVGETAVIANGTSDGSILRVLRGEPGGTVFSSGSGRMAGKKRWLAFFPESEGVVVVDAGAARALVERNSSLLPAGIVSVEGDFPEGSVVSIRNQDQGEIGRGLVNFSSKDLARILGCRSCSIDSVLGRNAGFEEAVHRDNLVVFRSTRKEKP